MSRDVEELIEYVGRHLLDRPGSTDVQTETENGTTMFHLDVNENDRGKIIGKGGRTAQALRTVVRASGALRDERFQFDILD